ncbi:restriction endonuclease subunit S [uncultured Acinetobacter sp.]|uniref:restriction endonuclease subunit S n=1 Tax=uncultured Acinetobacter sp. TaxID=165433 RepID=UPI00258D4360|nr:restriction endonuclease subunit S [uncultured Acinetobacter sp.]
MEKQKCPEIRFSGFGGEWRIRSWRDTVDISTNMVDPRINEYGELFHVGPGNIESFIGQFYNNILKVKDSNLISGKFYFKKGDIIYGKINPQLAKYVIAPFEGLASADAYILNTKNGVIQNYLYAILQTKDFYKYTVSVSSRTGMPKINREELNVYNYLSPSEAEQTQIGHFFQNLDQSIALHEKKLAQTQNLKKAMLEKMFPKVGSKQPEIRLKGFGGQWKKKFLKDEVEFFSGLTYSPDDLINKNGTLVLRSSNVKDNQICTDDNVYVIHDAVNVSNVEVGDIIVVVRNGSRDLIGKHAVINEQMKNTVIGAFMTGIKAKNPYFINALFDTSLFYVAVGRNLGATINQITTGMFKQMEFRFPDINEQIAIGQFFKQLDETLVLQQHQLQILKNLKQAFLQKMFV